MNIHRCQIVIGLAVSLLLHTTALNALEGYQQYAFQLPGNAELLLVADADADGNRELLVLVERELRIYYQTDNRFDFVSGYQTIQLPGDAVGWDIGRSNRSDGQSAITILALIDGKEVLAWEMRQQRLVGPEVLLSGLDGFMPKGVNRLHFAMDINDDDRDDLVIPGAGSLNIHVRDPDGSFQQPIRVQIDMRLRTSLDQNQLERETGQAVTIPLMEMRDVNGDGLPDLVSRTEERLDVFTAQPQNSSYFSPQPSFSLDIAAIEERLGEFDIDRLDFSNLTGVVALTHEEILEDIDGDGIDDLLLREGGKVSLFAGNANGVDLTQPKQILRSGGNVLSTFLFDEDEDGLKDLWLWRVEPVSVGDVFLWLAVSGSVAVEAFIYPNEGESFARRPTRKITVSLKFPSAIRLATSVMDIAREARESGDLSRQPSAEANVDGNSNMQDLLILANNQVDIFFNAIEPVTRNDPFLDGLNYSREQDEYEIDVRNIIENVSINGEDELSSVRSRSSDTVIRLDEPVTHGDIIAIALNNDDKDDVLIFTERGDNGIKGVLLLSDHTD